MNHLQEFIKERLSFVNKHLFMDGNIFSLKLEYSERFFGFSSFLDII